MKPIAEIVWAGGIEDSIKDVKFYETPSPDVGTLLYTHPVKEFFEDEPQAEELHEILQSNTELTDEEIDKEIEYATMQGYGSSYLEGLSDGFERARAMLRKAQEK